MERPHNASDEIDEMSLKLLPRQRQEQVLAPMLRESLRVLQMDHQTLVNEVRHEAETNPVVELEEPNDDIHEADETVPDEMPLDRYESSSAAEDDADSFAGTSEEASERHRRFFDRQEARESLQEHLIAQIGAAGFSDDDRQLAELIVGDVNDDGRYVGSLEELSEVVNVDTGHLEDILRRVQEFDPPGVAARNLRECLSIQVSQLNVAESERAILMRLVGGHLSAVAERNISRLAHKLKLSVAHCRSILRILRTLEPKPGRPFIPNGRHTQFIYPELSVEDTPSGLLLTLRESDLPSLHINPTYQRMLTDAATSEETRAYLKERFDSAALLNDSIRRRGETILHVAESVFARQHAFFKHGFGALEPLTIEEIAGETGYHGTTVGRAVRGKYVQTPRGIFELRKFFCVGRLDECGHSVSSAAVKCRISDLVNSETGSAMTDEELSAALTSTGLSISRRTVTKYRTALGIPTASKRTKRRTAS